MAEEKKDEAEVPAGPKRIMGMSIPMFAFVAVNILTMLGGFYVILNAALLYKKPKITESQVVEEIQKKEKKKEANPDEGFFTVPFAESTINLRTEQGGKSHFATVEMVVVCATESCAAQIKDIRAKVEDTVQSIVGARSYIELGSLDIKFRIKHEMLNQINAMLKDAAATEVLFTNFIVQ